MTRRRLRLRKMTNIKPLRKAIGEEFPAFLDEKENPDEWYLMIGKAVGEYSVHTANKPDDYEEMNADLPPEDRDATENVGGWYQIGTSAWVEQAFADDCNFVGEYMGHGGKLDTRLMHILVIHEDMLSDEALDVANGEEEPAEAS